MEISIFLAKVVGSYLLVMGVAVLLRREEMLKLTDEIVRRDALRYTLGTAIFLAGALLVASHNVWGADWRVVITLVGWGAFVKGVLFLLFTDRGFEKFVTHYNHGTWYNAGGIVSLALGVYLLVAGFAG